MTPARKLVNYIAAEPFEPFRIKMASGDVYEIRHSEMLLVGRTSARVHTPPLDDPDGPYRWHDLSLMLVEQVESLEPANEGTANG